jgi:outer membrane immunogenic protein
MNIRTLLIGAVAAGAMVTAAHAADLQLPVQPAPAVDTTAFSFEGLYLGGYAGGAIANGTWGTVGVLAGVNFAVSDAVLAGVEVQGGLFGNNGATAWNAYALGHLGVLVTDSVLAYAALGVGVLPTSNNSVSDSGWLAGGGLEFAATDSLSFRAEGLYGRSWSTSRDGAQFTVGLIWHAH